MWATVDTYEIERDCYVITSIKYFEITCNIVESFLDCAQTVIKIYMVYTELRHIITKL